MFVMFKKFRISFIEYVGTTGFKTSIYRGSKKVGKAWRDDGKKNIEDIEFELTQSAEKELKQMIKAKKRLLIAGIEQPWTVEFSIYSMMENKSIYENLKKALQGNRIVVQFKGDDYFSVVSGLKNNPKDFAILKKENPRGIEKRAEDIIHYYEENRRD